jgi:hypothetical protein
MTRTRRLVLVSTFAVAVAMGPGCAGNTEGEETSGNAAWSTIAEQGGETTIIKPGIAACIGSPVLRVEPTRAAPGQALRLHGEGFDADCVDTPLAKKGPDRSVPIEFRQDSRTWRLATVAAESDSSFDLELAPIGV